MLEHAKRFSASSANRWVKCTASVIAIENSGIVSKTSKYAQEGTLAHNLAAIFLTSECDSFPSTFTEEDILFLYNYIDYIDNIKNDTSEVFIEQRVNYSNLAPQGYDVSNDFFGTADAIIYDKTLKTLHIVDLKWGKNVKVDAENNYQLIMYAIGAIEELKDAYEIEHVSLHIAQPRMYNFSKFDISTNDIEVLKLEIKQAVFNIISGNSEFKPSKKTCTFCPYKTYCPANLEILKNISNFKKLELNSDDYSYILDNKDLVISFINSIEADLVDRVKNGLEITGYGLGKAKTNKKWTDDAESKLLEILNVDLVYNKKLITITEAKKLVDNGVLESLTFKPEGADIIVKI